MIEDAAGRVTAQSEVPTTPAGLAHLRAAHRLPPDTPVALETATVAFFVARQLAASGLSPQVIDAHEVRLKAHRPTQKSDRRDAFELCEGLRRGSYRAIVHVPRAEVLRLRETLSRRRHFVRLQSAQISTVKALLRGAGLGGLSRSLGSERGWAKVLAALAEHGDVRAYVAQHRALWRCAREQIATLEEKMAIAVVATIGPTPGIVCRRRRGSAKGTCCSASARGRPTDRWPARGHRSSPRVWHRGSGRRQSCGRCSAKRRIMRNAPTTPSTRRRERRRHAAGPRPSYVTLVRWCHAVQAREVAGDVACGSDKEDASQSSAANAVLPLTRRHAARTASAAALASLVAANR